MIAGCGDIRLREARTDELELLSELCLRSKAVWGYDADFMAACRRELMLAAEQLVSTAIRVAELEGRPIGVAQIAVDRPVADLVKLFVEPQQLGRGCGRLLFEWALAAARGSGASSMTIDADPGAVPFYIRMGARPAGMVPSGSIPGRFLPRLEVALGASCDISGCREGPQGSRVMKTYTGAREFDGLMVQVDGAPLSEHYDIKRFTTWGFEWTYEGESPQQLALAILYDHLGDGPRAIALSEPFMREVVANLDNDWVLTSDDVQRAVEIMEARK